MNEKINEEPLGVLVFDLDGTLTDTSGDIAFSANHIRQLAGLEPIPTKEVLRAVGRGAPYLIREVLGIKESGEVRLRELLPEFQRHYLAHQGERAALYPGIEEAIARLSFKYDLYVLSNKPDTATKNEVARNGIGRYFREVWGAGVLSGLKPDPIGIETALRLSGLPKHKALMIGDLAVDIQTGINAGVGSIHVTWGFSTLLANDPRPTGQVSSAAELLDMVERLLA